MTNDELKVVLKYCAKLSSAVIPKKAHEVGLSNYDYSVNEFLRDLSGATNIEDFNVTDDMFYSKVFNNMKKDLPEEIII